jgi:hypothetical protein
LNSVLPTLFGLGDQLDDFDDGHTSSPPPFK